MVLYPLNPSITNNISSLWGAKPSFLDKSVKIKLKGTNKYLSYSSDKKTVVASTTKSEFKISFNSDDFFTIRSVGAAKDLILPKEKFVDNAANNYGNTVYTYSYSSKDQILLTSSVNSLEYADRKGGEWEIYPVMIDNKVYYKIQNRSSGLVLSITDGKVNQVMEDDQKYNIYWEITSY